MNKSRGGRPSKGERELLGTRAVLPLADAARQRAAELGLNMNDYLLALVANDTHMPQFAPTQPDRTRMELPIPAA